MGRVILCAGEKAKTAYYFSSTGVSIYSIEELCHYLKHYTEHLNEELLSPSLANYVRNELKLSECAARLDRLSENHAGIKDAVLAILSAAGHYNDEEIKSILAEYEMLSSLTAVQRKKRYADKCLNDNRNSEAMRLYRSIVYSNETDELTMEEYGNILHNIAVIHTRSGAFSTAAGEFRKAYEMNGNRQSLKQYFFALKLGHRDDEFDAEISSFADDKQLIDQIENELYYISDTEENTFDYHELKKVRELKEKGRVAEYYRAADEIVTHLKNKYRTENG